MLEAVASRLQAIANRNNQKRKGRRIGFMSSGSSTQPSTTGKMSKRKPCCLQNVTANDWDQASSHVCLGGVEDATRSKGHRY